LKWFVIIALFLSNSAFTQTRSFDNWTSASISYNLTKALSVSLEEGLRLSDFNLSSAYQDLTVKYKLNDFIKFAGTWRFAGVDGIFDAEHLDNRFALDLNLRYALKPFLITFRTRYQSRYRDIFVSENGTLPNNYLRNKLGIRYRDLKKIDPEIGVELYTSTNRYTGNFSDKFRLYAGFGFDLAKRHEMEVNYIYQPEIQVSNPHSNHIIALAYSFDLSGWLKDQKKIKKEAPKQNIIWYYNIP